MTAPALKLARGAQPRPLRPVLRNFRWARLTVEGRAVLAPGTARPAVLEDGRHRIEVDWTPLDEGAGVWRWRLSGFGVRDDEHTEDTFMEPLLVAVRPVAFAVDGFNAVAEDPGDGEWLATCTGVTLRGGEPVEVVHVLDGVLTEGQDLADALAMVRAAFPGRVLSFGPWEPHTRIGPSGHAQEARRALVTVS